MVSQSSQSQCSGLPRRSRRQMFCRGKVIKRASQQQMRELRVIVNRLPPMIVDNNNDLVAAAVQRRQQPQNLVAPELRELRVILERLSQNINVNPLPVPVKRLYVRITRMKDDVPMPSRGVTSANIGNKSLPQLRVMLTPMTEHINIPRSILNPIVDENEAEVVELFVAEPARTTNIVNIIPAAPVVNVGPPRRRVWGNNIVRKRTWKYGVNTRVARPREISLVLGNFAAYRAKRNYIQFNAKSREFLN